MKTNEMLNNYVATHLVGSYEQSEFVKQFIEALGLELDGRWFILRSDFDCKIQATLGEITIFVVNQVMSRAQFNCFEPFQNEFQVVEMKQPVPSRSNFFEALEGGRRNAEKYDYI